MGNEFDKTFQVVSKSKHVTEDEFFNDSRKRWDYYTKTLEIAPCPLHVDVELTNACNLKCVMCERQNMKRKVGFMSFDLYAHIINQCLEHHVDSIKLNLWGESTIHPDLVKMIGHAKDRGITNTQFNTNGVLMGEKLAAEIFESGLDRMTFSVDGASRETYERVRNKSDYNKVMENLSTLMAIKQRNGFIKPLITLQIIRMKDTEKEIQEFIDRWRELADYITVTNIGTTSGMDENLAMSSRDLNKMKKIPCPQLWQRLSIYWNGDVTVCCSDFDSYLKIGNIKEKSIYDLWHGDELNDFRKRHKNLDFKGLVCLPCTGNLV